MMMKIRKVKFGIPVLAIVLAILIVMTSQFKVVSAPIQDNDLSTEDSIEVTAAPVRGGDIFSVPYKVATNAAVGDVNMYSDVILYANAPFRGNDIF